MEEVKDIMLRKGMNIAELIQELENSSAFMAKHLAEACKIFEEMVIDDQCFVFFSFTANLVATGIRGVISRMVERGYVDAIITTGGALDHDIARALGGKYYAGSFDLDDKELHNKDIHRLGNVLIPLDSYGLIIEKFVRFNLKSFLENQKSVSPSQLCRIIGEMLNDEHSILRQAYLRSVPVYCPGIVDSSFGTALFFLAQTTKFNLDLFSDMKELLDIVYSYKRTGALIVGGGISKHHLLWWNQFKEGLDYCVYITTATEYDGSLSGARPREAISWKKLKPDSKQTFLNCDASIALPLIMQYCLEKIG